MHFTSCTHLWLLTYDSGQSLAPLIKPLKSPSPVSDDFKKHLLSSLAQVQKRQSSVCWQIVPVNTRIMMWIQQNEQISSIIPQSSHVGTPDTPQPLPQVISLPWKSTSYSGQEYLGESSFANTMHEIPSRTKAIALMAKIEIYNFWG